MSRGVQRESEKKSTLASWYSEAKEEFRLLSVNWFSIGRLSRLIIRLYTVGLIQIIVCFDSHMRGTSIVVGIMIFSIVVG